MRQEIRTRTPLPKRRGSNGAIAQRLASYGRGVADPAEVVDVYTRQRSLLVDAHDLAVMGASLTDGGVNPAYLSRALGLDVFASTARVPTA